VHQHGQIEFGGECRDLQQVLTVDGVGSVRRDGRRDERIVAIRGGEFAGVCDAAIRRGRVGRGKVDDGLPEHAAHAGELGGAGDFLLEVIHVHHRGDATLDHLDDPVQGAPVDELAVHEVFLEGKDETPQPVGDVVAQPAKHGHRRVGVRVDHAWEHEIASRIDRLRCRVAIGQRGGADGDDAGILDDHSTLLDHVLARVHRDHVRVGHDQVRRLRATPLGQRPRRSRPRGWQAAGSAE
jgi:hypothetical protein